MARLLALLLISCSLLVAACGDDSEEPAAGGESTPAATETAAPEETTTDDGGETAAEPCEKTADPKPRPEGKLAKPKEELQPGKTYVAEVITTCGEFEITLDSERSPKTGGSFAYMARKGFFDGLKFHRVIPGFVIQAGDPRGTGEGGPGYSVVEAPPQDLVYEKGIVAMAKTQLEDPGTSGSQFFVVTAEDAGLPPEYALLGKVTSGLEVVEKIGVVQTGPDDQPVNPVVIQQVKIVEK
jgi:peptidyl-prolyl cis-trans isomerase B (cyclophilin B)